MEVENFKDLGIHGRIARHTWEQRIILKMDLKERGWGMLTGLLLFKKGTKCRLL